MKVQCKKCDCNIITEYEDNHLERYFCNIETLN